MTIIKVNCNVEKKCENQHNAALRRKTEIYNVIQRRESKRKIFMTFNKKSYTRFLATNNNIIDESNKIPLLWQAHLTEAMKDKTAAPSLSETFRDKKQLKFEGINIVRCLWCSGYKVWATLYINKISRTMLVPIYQMTFSHTADLCGLPFHRKKIQDKTIQKGIEQ